MNVDDYFSRSSFAGESLAATNLILNSIESDIVEARQILQSRNTQYNSIESLANLLKDENSILKSEIYHKNAELEKLWKDSESNLNTQALEFDDQIQACNSEMDRVAKQCSAAIESRNAFAAQVSALSVRNKELELRVSQLEADKQMAEATAHKHQEEGEQWRAKVVELTQYCSMLEGSHSEMRSFQRDKLLDRMEHTGHASHANHTSGYASRRGLDGKTTRDVSQSDTALHLRISELEFANAQLRSSLDTNAYVSHSRPSYSQKASPPARPTIPVKELSRSVTTHPVTSSDPLNNDIGPTDGVPNDMDAIVLRINEAIEWEKKRTAQNARDIGDAQSLPLLKSGYASTSAEQQVNRPAAAASKSGRYSNSPSLSVSSDVLELKTGHDETRSESSLRQNGTRLSVDTVTQSSWVHDDQHDNDSLNSSVHEHESANFDNHSDHFDDYYSANNDNYEEQNNNDNRHNHDNDKYIRHMESDEEPLDPGGNVFNAFDESPYSPSEHHDRHNRHEQQRLPSVSSQSVLRQSSERCHSEEGTAEYGAAEVGSSSDYYLQPRHHSAHISTQLYDGKGGRAVTASSVGAGQQHQDYSEPFDPYSDEAQYADEGNDDSHFAPHQSTNFRHTATNDRLISGSGYDDDPYSLRRLEEEMQRFDEYVATSNDSAALRTAVGKRLVAEERVSSVSSVSTLEDVLNIPI